MTICTAVFTRWGAEEHRGTLLLTHLTGTKIYINIQIYIYMNENCTFWSTLVSNKHIILQHSIIKNRPKDKLMQKIERIVFRINVL